MRRIGIYSGAFDPVHNGHLAFALQALDTAGLDEVVFFPEKIPRGKSNVTDLTHRFAILQRATAPFSKLSVRRIDIDQFCVKGTLPELRLMFAGAELSLLLGSDVVKTFPERWANLDELFANMRLVVALRQGDNCKELKQLMRQLDAKVKPRYLLVDSPLAGVSSTRIRSGEIIRDVGPEVSAYIKEYHLYGAAG